MQFACNAEERSSMKQKLTLPNNYYPETKQIIVFNNILCRFSVRLVDSKLIMLTSRILRDVCFNLLRMWII